MNCNCPRGRCYCAEVPAQRPQVLPPVSQSARAAAIRELDKAIEQRVEETHRLAREIDELQAAQRLLREAI